MIKNKALKIKKNSILPAKLKLWLVSKKINNPYADINDQYNAIFIHIPKNAGISIETALFNQKVGHKFLIAFKAHDQYKFSNYFKFSFVRNPYDRLLSAFFFMKKGGRNKTDQMWSQKNLSEIQTFQDFVLNLKSDSFAKKIMRWQHFRPQLDYITDEKNNIALDYMGRVETIESDIKKIQSKLNLESISLGHLNKSQKVSKDYYNENLKDIVKKRYQKDFEQLGYY